MKSNRLRRSILTGAGEDRHLDLRNRRGVQRNWPVLDAETIPRIEKKAKMHDLGERGCSQKREGKESL